MKRVQPIRTTEAHETALHRAAELMSRTDQASLDELDVLTAVIERWERGRNDVAAPSAIEAIRFRMRQDDLAPRDLEPLIGSRARVSEILSGTRPLTLEMIKALHVHLGIPFASMINTGMSDASKALPAPSRAAVDKLRALGVMSASEDVPAYLARAGADKAGATLLRKTRTPRTNVKTDLGSLQAWCAAVLLKAAKAPAPRTRKKERGQDAARELARLSALPDGLNRVGDALAQLGIVFVIMEHLPGTFLDGAAMCRSDGVPVIALTLRHDRIDNFWFTLLHEFCHVGHHLGEDVSLILDDLEVKSTDVVEGEADAFAKDALIPPEIWEEAMNDPTSFSSEGLMSVAGKAGVHPAIVAGRWQRDNNDYRRFAKLLGRGEVRARLRSNGEAS